MLNAKKPLVAVLLSILAVSGLAGCAADDGDGADATAGAMAQQQSNEITLQNWEDHPKLREHFDLLSETTIAFREQFWTIEKKENLCDGPGEESRMKMTNAGKIRNLTVRWGSDDSYSTLQAIYDATGKLRLVKSTGRNVHGSGEDRMVFFDKEGHIIWEAIQDWTPTSPDDTIGVPQPWRKPRPVTEDEFDAFAFDDPNFVDAPAKVWSREPACN